MTDHLRPLNPSSREAVAKVATMVAAMGSVTKIGSFHVTEFERLHIHVVTVEWALGAEARSLISRHVELVYQGRVSFERRQSSRVR